MEKNLLYFILGNIEMAKYSTQQLIEISEDGEFRKTLLDDLSVYETFYDKAMALKTDEEDVKELSIFTKFSTKASMTVETFKDRSSHKMSEMLLKGLDMGIKDANENIDKAHKVNERPQVIDLAVEYRNFLQELTTKYRQYK